MSSALVATRDTSPTPSQDSSSEAAVSSRPPLQQQQQQQLLQQSQNAETFPKIQSSSVELNNNSNNNKSELDQTSHCHGTHVTTSTSVDKTKTTNDLSTRISSSPLPSEAQRILTQVARTGCYTRLPWTAPEKPPRKRPRTTSETTSEVHYSQPLFTSLQQVMRISVQAVLEYYFKSRGGYKMSPAEQCRHKATITTTTINTTDTSSSPGQLEERIFQQRLQRLLTALQAPSSNDGEPPFTIQRIAEVLVAPERYYTQTHKLCNCLEKLLLVTSSANAFGGIDGGDTSQTRREAQERAALENEKSRSHGFRRQPPISPERPRHSPEDLEQDTIYQTSPECIDEREYLEAAARASLRTKFDHLDQGNGMIKRDVARMMLAESRGLTNSPPPPSVSSMAAAAAVASHLSGHGTLLRHHESSELGRTSSSSSLLFPDGVHPNLSLLQATAVSGLSPVELTSLSPTAATDSNKDVDLESRSSASSDVDSESDDMDDSASDRSDGSSDHEPRSMVWRQQQQRLSQRLWKLQPVSSNGEEGVDHPDDSGGSDSSMSDMTD